jgi:hypothetical protein
MKHCTVSMVGKEGDEHDAISFRWAFELNSAKPFGQRLHDSLEKDTPNWRIVEQRPGVNAKVVSITRLGGLHHRYT